MVALYKDPEGKYVFSTNRKPSASLTAGGSLKKNGSLVLSPTSGVPPAGPLRNESASSIQFRQIDSELQLQTPISPAANEPQLKRVSIIESSAL